MDDLFVVEVAESVDDLVEEVLGFRYRKSLPFLDEIEHVLGRSMYTPLVHSYSNM